MADHSDDLDQLLDSALDDFQSLNLTSSAQRGENNEGNKHDSSSMPSEVKGLGMGLPDLRSKQKGKQKVPKESHVSEALDKLREQTREAVKVLESVSEPKPTGQNLGNDAMMEDLVKQFEELAGSQIEDLNFKSDGPTITMGDCKVLFSVFSKIDCRCGDLDHFLKGNKKGLMHVMECIDVYYIFCALEL